MRQLGQLQRCHSSVPLLHFTPLHFTPPFNSSISLLHRRVFALHRVRRLQLGRRRPELAQLHAERRNRLRRRWLFSDTPTGRCRQRRSVGQRSSSNSSCSSSSSSGVGVIGQHQRWCGGGCGSCRLTEGGSAVCSTVPSAKDAKEFGQSDLFDHGVVLNPLEERLEGVPRAVPTQTGRGSHGGRVSERAGASGSDCRE